jgi:hypothetical protein
MPTPGRAVSLAITVKLLRPCRTNSAMIIRCGLPTPKNPPIMTEVPSGIFSTAADKAIVLCICLIRSEAALVILAVLSRDGFDLSNGGNWPSALFAVGEHRYHVRNEQRDQNAECDVIGNCHGEGPLSFVIAENSIAKPEITR